MSRPCGSTQPADVQRKVRRMLDAGRTVYAAAKAHGVSEDAVRVIRDGRLLRKAPK